MNWQRAGAASGILSAILFGAAFVVFLGQDPTGTPRIPDVANAADVVAYIEDHRRSMQTQVLLNSVAIVLFLFFLGSLWGHLRAAEGGPARVSAIASAGGIAGAVAVLLGLAFFSTAVVAPIQTVGDVLAIPTLYTLSVMTVGVGGAAFTVFFLAAGKVIVDTGALPKVLGVLAILVGIVAALGFVTIYADEGVWNAATGAFGYWLRFGAFVIWLFFAGIALTAAVGGGRRTTRRRR